MEFPSVDLFIPVYKVEPFIERCILSILQQKYPRLRIVIVNDASPDKSIQIARNVVEQHNVYKHNVIFIERSTNGGISEVRAQMLGMIEGKYILFIDSDDYWEGDDVVTRWVAKAEEEHAEIVFSNYYVNYPKHEIFKNAVLSYNSARDAALALVRMESHGFLWNKLIFSDLLIPLQELAKKTNGIWEDLILVIVALSNASAVSYITDITPLHYVQYNNNAITSSYDITYIERIKNNFELIYNTLTGNEFLKEPFTSVEVEEAIAIGAINARWSLFSRLPLSQYSKIRKITHISQKKDIKKFSLPLKVKYLYKMCMNPFLAPFAYIVIRVMRKLQHLYHFGSVKN